MKAHENQTDMVYTDIKLKLKNKILLEKNTYTHKIVELNWKIIAITAKPRVQFPGNSHIDQIYALNVMYVISDKSVNENTLHD